MLDPAIALLAAAALFLVSGLLPLQRWASRLGTAVPYLPGLAASALLALVAASILVSGQPSIAALPSLVPGTRSLIRLDPIGTYFLLLVAVASAIVFGFSWVTRPTGERPAALHALVLGQIGVVAAGDGVLFLLSWGITAVAGAALVANSDDELEGARSAITTAYLGLLLLGGALLAIGGTSGLAFTTLAATARKLTPGHQAVTAVVVFGALAALAGVTPFQLRPGRSRAAASAGARALLAGLVAATAIYSLIRILGGWLRGGPGWLALVVIAVGAAAALRGALAALVETDLTRLVQAWSAQLAGMAFISVGATLAFIGHGVSTDAVLAMTASLLGAGSLVLLAAPLVLLGHHAAAIAGSAELDELAGLTQRAPAIAGALLIAAGGVATIPVLGGCLPTWLGLEAMLQPLAGSPAARAALVLGVIASALGVGLSGACLLRLAVLLGGEPPALARRATVPPTVAAAVVVLAAVPVVLCTAAAGTTVAVVARTAHGFGELGRLVALGFDGRLVAVARATPRLALELVALILVVHVALLILGRVFRPAPARSRPATAPSIDSEREPRLSAAGLAQPTAAALRGLYVVEVTIRPVIGDAPYIPTAIEVGHTVTPVLDARTDRLAGLCHRLGAWRDGLTTRLPKLGVGYAVLVILALLLGYAR